jgi:hypothetical protein
MRYACIAILCCVLAGCGSRDDERVARAPAGASAYAELGDDARLGAAAGCRDLVASRARDLAAEQIAAVDPELLRAELDVAAAVRTRASFRSLCSKAVPRVTPGLKVSFAGVTGNGRSFAYPTRSDRPLTIRGRIEPPPRGRVVAAREAGGPHPPAARIDGDGRFVFSDIELRKVADNSFLLRIDAPPNAPREVRFSALCLDCGAGGVIPER